MHTNAYVGQQVRACSVQARACTVVLRVGIRAKVLYG